jgi:hypothetical protein
MHAILRGALSGAIATVPQSIPFLLADRIGAIRTPPPVQITDEVAGRTNALPEQGERGFTPALLAAHVGYGASGGALYAVIRRFLPGSPAAAGLVFGELVWAGSYLGYLPALELYPSPEHDARQRTLVMIAAHAIYGIVLGTVEARLRRVTR